MEAKTKRKIKIESLTYLPEYARFILENRLNDYAHYQLQLSKELNLPLLNQLGDLSEDQLMELAKNSAAEFLQYLANNKARDQIKDSIDKWLTNRQPLIKTNEIVAEDITIVTYVRKQAFLRYLPDFSSNMEQVIEIIKELDLFLMESETVSTNTYVDLLHTHINEHAHFIEKVADATPGIIYLYDFPTRKVIYTNKSLKDLLGYNEQEFKLIQQAPFRNMICPEDINTVKEFQDTFQTSKDGEIRSCKYRLKHKNGEFRWIRFYETVFKRNSENVVTQKIGIAIDVHQQQLIAEQLRKSDMLHKQAEAITHLGNYILDLKTNTITWSDELFRIYGLEINNESLSREFIKSFHHPDDIDIVTNELENAINNKTPFDFYYRIIVGGNQKILHARGTVTYDENDNPTSILGTVQDVTEKQLLIRKLKQSDEMYRQAEALANMGNWSWNLITNELTWTDQLYKIYGLIPQAEKITIDRFLDFVHPEDRDNVASGVKLVYQQDFLDYTFRIITTDGTLKVLKSIAKVLKDENGKPITVIGTERDITEKEKLLERMRHSEYLYKQAQTLAHIGNWSWNITTNRVAWSEELYRIYEVDHGTEINFELFTNLLHPEDREMVINTISQCLNELKPYEIYHKILTNSGKVKIIHARGEVVLDKEGIPYELVGTGQDVTEYQVLLEKLKESDKLYKQAQALSLLGNWTVDLRNNTYSWSNEMFRIYELEEKDELNEPTWERYIHPDEKSEVLGHLQECISQKKNYEKIFRIQLPSGKVKVLHRKGELIYDDFGNAVKMIGTTQDITTQYETQQELKEKQTFIQKITDAAPSIISSYKVNTGEYLFVNQGLKKLLGYDPDEALQKGVQFIMGIVHPDDLPALTEKNNKALDEANADPGNNNIIIQFIYRMRHRNGEYRWFQTYGTIFDRNAQGKVDQVLNITHDITDRIKAEQKIEEQEFFIQQIAEASPTILYIFDIPSNSIEYVNREIYFILGYTTDEVKEMGGEVTKILYHSEEYSLLPERKESTKRFHHRNSMIQYECRVKSRDGDWKWILVREVIFKSDDDGKPLQILGAALDITKRKDMEKSLLQNSFQLEQSNASLEEFAYVASHDLKEPLRKISTFGDRLIHTQMEKLSDDGRIYLKKIVDASQRMQNMIDDLLSISMITGDRSFQHYSLQSVLDDVKQALEFKMEQKDAVVKSEHLPEANIVPSQFRHLFQNLIGNSLKFTRDGVQPVIEIKHSYLSGSELGNLQLADAGRYLKLEFIDNGIGFEEEYSGKIFQIFQRLHGRSEYEGTGIGLAICKKIVEHHGGVIFANGEPDKGAKFTIILPEVE